MTRFVALIAGISLLTTPVAAQVRPENCVPVFPLVDQAVVAAPAADVIAEPIAPVATAARRSFFGLPFLLPLLAAVGGGLAALTSGDNGPVSPA